MKLLNTIMIFFKLGVFYIFSLFLVVLTNAAQVTSDGDEGEGSLRQVISDAEEGDTITFSDSFTITIATPITINKNIEIDRPRERYDGVMYRYLLTLRLTWHSVYVFWSTASIILNFPVCVSCLKLAI